MAGSDLNTASAERLLAELGLTYLEGRAGLTSECLSEEVLSSVVDSRREFSENEREHVLGCPRCASLLASFRSARAIEEMPEHWHVRLEGISPHDSTSFPYQLLGRINLERYNFELCEAEDEWNEHVLAIRVNLVIDPQTDFFSLTLLEVPETIQTVLLKTPLGYEFVEPAEAEGIHELSRAISEYLVEDTYPLSSFLDYARAGLFEIGFYRASADAIGGGDKERDESFFLKSLGAVETAFDYELPSGLHADKFINVGKLCHSERWLHAIASSFNALFRDVGFDTVVAQGWAMATIARRLGMLRSEQTQCPPIADVMFEGYAPPLPVEDVRRDSRILVLVDVVVTGRLLEDLSAAVQTAGARVVAKGCIVSPFGAGKSNIIKDLRALWRLPMDLRKPESCPRCGVLETRSFNPFASCMTARAPEARSPSEFLDKDEAARTFWEAVDKAKAYEYHRIEGNAHFTGFVDTAKMLRHPEVGVAVVDQLRDLLAENKIVPGVILVPKRLRARLLAYAIKEGFSIGRRQPPLLCATGRSGRWRLPPEDRQKLASQTVLLIDSAAGHGKTLDLLSILADRAGARSVAAAVLLSRLSDSCEQAFTNRLSGGFHPLYRLPIRPIVIHGPSRDICPFCQRRAAVHNAAVDSRLEAIKRVDALLTNRRPRQIERPETVKKPQVEQPALFPSEPPSFFETCSPKVASGVTLHSLYAAMTNGMAALTLPEITTEAIPPAKRAAMLEQLPPGVLDWSRGVLDQDLNRCLATVNDRSLWRATADVLARERQAHWVQYLETFLTRATRQKKSPPATFWNGMACNAYLVTRRDPARKQELRGQLEQLRQVYKGTAVGQGLQQVLKAISI